MKIYTVYLKPDDEKTLQSAMLVPEGFSWPALLPGYNLIWSLMNRNWLLFIILLALFLLSFPQSLLKGEWALVTAALKTTIFVFLAVWANDLMRFSLKSQGYQMVGVVSGRNESEAQLRFFEEISGDHIKNFHA